MPCGPISEETLWQTGPGADFRAPRKSGDFVIIVPDLGIIVIEVKGWNPNDVLDGDPQTVRVRERGVEKNEVHPVRQARGYQNNL